MSAKERFAQALALVPELVRVEQIVRSAFRSDVTLMREIPEYLLNLGGKRIRPALTLLCARALEPRGAEMATEVNEQLLDVSAGIELIHMATLLHDDIVDQSPVRRHKPSPYAVYGTAATLLSGDFLLTRAFGLCARLDRTIIEATEQACIELVEGETLETPLTAEQHSVDSSITIARRKTAALFRLAAFSAAHLRGVDQRAKEAWAHFGESLGVAFQIIDDILDVTSDQATLGKQPGLDILERKPSLVNVLWLESGDPSAQRLRTPPGDPIDEQRFSDSAIAHLRGSTVIESAKQLATTYAEEARAHLQRGLTDSMITPAGNALSAVIDFALERLA